MKIYKLNLILFNNTMSFLSKESELINFINSKIIKKNQIEYNNIVKKITS